MHTAWRLPPIVHNPTPDVTTVGISLSDFIAACAGGGLFSSTPFDQPAGGDSLGAVLCRALERRPYRIRHPRAGDLAALGALETACWPAPLRTPPEEIQARIGRWPEGQWVLEMDGQVVGAIYGQRIVTTGALEGATAESAAALHREAGPIVQLLAVNVLHAVQDQGLGDQLLEFALQYCGALPGVERIAAVSLCREYPRHRPLPMEEYIRSRDADGFLLDPILRFHEAHGGRIAGLCPGYRPLDSDNLGYGVLVEYDPRSRAATRARAAARREPRAGPMLPLIEECVRLVMEGAAGWNYAPTRPLMEMGLDSLRLMELRTLLGRRTGRVLDAAFFFRYGTPEKIARVLDAGESRECGPVDSPPRPRPRRAASRPRPAGPAAGAIAIVGVACRFPGGADNPEAFWALLRGGGDAVTELPPERWDWGRYRDLLVEGGPPVSRHGGFLREADRFDAPFFHISPREAAGMDPQQRLLLTVAWEALERAGMNPAALAGSRTGVFVGIFSHDYETLRIKADGRAAVDPHFATGSAASMAAGRIAYRFGFEGPALVVDTACSSSLVAVHLACRSLRDGESEIALAGGVNLLLSPELTVAFSRAGMLSPGGHCRAFDAAADGYVRSEGCGMLVLKPLARALADKDPVWAVLRGSAVNQDGASNGLTAPNGLAQEAVIRAALADAGVEPGEVAYVEAHGTGTPLGDPVELSALAAAYGSGRRTDAPLLVGSVKANIGHAEAAAGIAGLIKVVLSMGQRRIPPQIHFQTLNPQVILGASSLAIPVRGAPWDGGPNGRRLAGVSSFGFSGTNVHVVVEAAPDDARRADPDGPERPLHLLALSAGTPEALERLARRYEACLESTADGRLADLCYTANAGRAHFSCRLAALGGTAAELRDLLRAPAASEADGVFRGDAPAPPPVAFLFTGQGAQFAGMGRQLYETQPTFREALERCAALLDGQLESPLLEAIYPPSRGAADRVDQTAFTQPALFALEYALCGLWKSWGVEPAAVLGHSVGEYAAACLAGVFSLEEGLGLIATRARLMQALPRDGAMAAVSADEESVRAALAPVGHAVAVAAINGPRLTVISGRAEAVGTVTARLEAQGVRCVRLTVSHAFHSPLMDPVLAPYEAVARGVRSGAPRIPLISNLTGEAIGDAIASADYWVRHVRQPVRFFAGMEALYRRGIRLFVEIGPRPVLTGMAKAFLPDDCAWLPSLQPGRSDWEQMLWSLGALYARGVQVDWRGFDADYGRRKAQAPTYPFAGSRHWFAAPPVGPGAPPAAPPAECPDEGPDAPPEGLFYRVAWRRQAAEPDGDAAPGLTGIAFQDRLRSQATACPPASPGLVAGIEALSLAYLQAALTELGWGFALGSRFTTAAAARSLGVVDRLHPLFGRFLGILAEEGYLRRSEEGWEVRTAWPPQEPERLRRELLDRHPAAEAEWTVLGRCGEGLAGVLRGERDPLPLLFPEADLTTAARLYASSPTFGGANQRLAAAVAAIHAGRAGRPMRILEIGAGTGGTTAAVLAALGGARVEYTFTDIAPLFLAKARERFGDAALTYRRLDIEAAPAGQGFGPGTYDAVVAANVLHATADLRRTLRRVRELLASGGTLLLLEGVQPRRWLDLVFGLLDGWWKFRDHDLRPSHPLLGAAAWEALLAAEGFVGTTAAAAGGDLFPQVVITARRRPAATAGPAAPARRWLVCADGSGVGPALADRLRGRGERVTMLRAGERFARIGEGVYTLDPTRREELGRALAAAGGPPPHAVVHLWGIEAPGEGGDEAVGPAALRRCAGLLHLVQCLIEREGPPPALTLVTRGAVRAGRDPGASGLVQAPLWGLAQVIAAEHPELCCRRIDLDGAAPEPDALLTALLRLGREERLALREDGPYAARLVPIANDGGGRTASRVRPDGAYLITGGLGGLGLLFADRLVSRGAGQVVLLGRQGRPADGTAAAAALARMEATAARIEVVQADVARRADLERVLAAVRRSGRPLAGVIHAAGVFEDRLLAAHTADRFARVFAAKVQGAWNLHELTRTAALDFFLLCASATGLACSAGLGNYVAANAFLDALAHARRAMGLPGLSIGWGPWMGTGMASAVGAARQAQWAEAGLTALLPARALAAFDALLGSPEPQMAVLEMDWPRFGAAAAERSPFFEEVLPAAPDGAPAGEADLRAALRAAPAAQRRNLLQRHLAARVAGLLGRDPAALDPRQGLFQLGLDSLTAMALRNRLQRDLACALEATLLFRYPTLEALTEHLLAPSCPSGPTSPCADADREGAAGAIRRDDEGDGGATPGRPSAAETENLLVRKLEELGF